MSSSIGKSSQEDQTGWIVLAVIIIIFIFFIIWGTCSESGKSTFRNLKNKVGGSNSKLRELDIIMFINPTCPWCQKMIAILKSENKLGDLSVVNVASPEGAKIAKKFGSMDKPVPSFISRTNQTGTYGYRESVNELIEALQPPSSQEVNSQGSELKDLQVILIKKEGCGWCQKAKEHCTEIGVMDMIGVVAISSPEGQELAGMLPPDAGYPSWISLKTKKYVIGFKPFDQVVQSLV